VKLRGSEKGVETIHFYEFIGKVEEILWERVYRNHPHPWREDFITESLLQTLRDQFHRTDIEGYKEELTTHWSAYKYNGSAEQKYGDIGILVKVNRRDGQSLEGVAFLEAKRRAKNKDTFDAMREQQLQTIERNAPQSMLLLYDYDLITTYSTNQISSSLPFTALLQGMPMVSGTYAVVTPISTALALGTKDITLYRWAVPVSHQLCFRYVHGLDLEFSREAINTAKGFADKEGMPSYLLVLHVSERGASSDDGPEVDRTTWTALDQEADGNSPLR
jgi:hypothetical protein